MKLKDLTYQPLGSKMTIRLKHDPTVILQDGRLTKSSKEDYLHGPNPSFLQRGKQWKTY